MKKGKVIYRYLLYLIVIFLVFLIAGGGAIWYMRYKDSHRKLVSMPVPLTDKDMDWGVYTNNNFGFSMRFPYRIYMFKTIEGNDNSNVTKSGTVVSPISKIIISSKDENKMQATVEVFDTYNKEVSLNEYKDGYLYTSGSCDLRWGFVPDNIKFIDNNNLKVLRVIGGDKNNNQYWACYYFKSQKDNLVVIDTRSFEQLNWLYSAVDYGIIKTMVESIKL